MQIVNDYINNNYKKIEKTAYNVFKMTGYNPHEVISLFYLHLHNNPSYYEEIIKRDVKEMYKIQSRYFVNQREWYNSKLNKENRPKEQLADNYTINTKSETNRNDSKEEILSKFFKDNELEKINNISLVISNLSNTDQFIYYKSFEQSYTDKEIAKMLNVERYTITNRIKHIKDFISYKIGKNNNYQSKIKW